MVAVLDLTVYEVGNALLHGRANATAEQVAAVLDALETICPGLTLYDAAVAAVAGSRGATLVTLDGALLRAGLGSRPSKVASGLT